MNTVGPAISLRTSCCDLPQKEQYKRALGIGSAQFRHKLSRRPAKPLAVLSLSGNLIATPKFSNSVKLPCASLANKVDETLISQI